MTPHDLIRDSWDADAATYDRSPPRHLRKRHTRAPFGSGTTHGGRLVRWDTTRDPLRSCRRCKRQSGSAPACTVRATSTGRCGRTCSGPTSFSEGRPDSPSSPVGRRVADHKGDTRCPGRRSPPARSRGVVARAGSTPQILPLSHGVMLPRTPTANGPRRTGHHAARLGVHQRASRRAAQAGRCSAACTLQRTVARTPRAVPGPLPHRRP